MSPGKKSRNPFRVKLFVCLFFGLLFVVAGIKWNDILSLLKPQPEIRYVQVAPTPEKTKKQVVKPTPQPTVVPEPVAQVSSPTPVPPVTLISEGVTYVPEKYQPQNAPSPTPIPIPTTVAGGLAYVPERSAPIVVLSVNGIQSPPNTTLVTSNLDPETSELVRQCQKKNVSWNKSFYASTILACYPGCSPLCLRQVGPYQ